MKKNNSGLSRGIRILLIIVAGLIGILSDANAQVSGTNNFRIEVPRKTQYAIYQIKATVTLNGDTGVNPITFTITDPEGASVSIGPLSPGDPPDGGEFPIVGGRQDSVTIDPPPDIPADPVRYQYNIYIYPNTNTDFSGGECNDIMPTPSEFYTVEVATGPQITGVCLVSFDLNALEAECLDVNPIDPSLDPLVATVDGFPGPQACQQFRPAVDVILVLDKSGSMGGSTLGGTPSTKITALHDAVKDFIQVWSNVRANEPSPPLDRIGLVFFDGNEHWMNDPSLGIPVWSSLSPGLHEFEAVKNLISNNIDSVSAGGSTSMGDGLIAAANAFSFGDNHRKVVLVMSNGKENTTMRVKVDDPANPQEVQTYVSGNPAATTALPNQNQFQIYAVTVGTSTAVSADINEDIASATGGFYINSEDNEALLRTFFLEILQNFIKFNTWETVRMISGEVADNSAASQPYIANFPLSTSAQRVAINLLWNRNLGDLRLIVTPPGGGSPIERTGDGAIYVNLSLPLQPPYDVTKDWNIQIESINAVQNIPFDLVVLVDGLTIKSDLGFERKDYEPGDKIRLQMMVRESGKPVRNLDTAIAKLVKPGESIGDILSDSGADTTQPDNDIWTNADAKLHNELQSNPQALDRDEDIVVFFDNGNPENGDDIAGDGIYSALYSAEVYGHYNFLFTAEGEGERSGRFSRQQLKSVHVRGVPDSTGIQCGILWSVPQLASGAAVTYSLANPGTNIMRIKMRPKTKGGSLMGPGWSNYFWLTSPGGQAFKLRDNLDGTYSTSIRFSGNNPPELSLHFLRVSSAIDDSVTPDKLPVSLGSNTMIVDSIKPSHWSVSLHGGGNVPVGSFGNNVDSSLSLGADVEYWINRTFSLGLFLGYDAFNGVSGAKDVDVYNLSLYGKAYLTGGIYRPFVIGGLGAYYFDPGSTHFGVTVGAGVQFDLSIHFAADVTAKYHTAFTPGTNSAFSTVYAGIIYRF